jgi:TolB-like protein/Tfp pilus assembly protein PilF
MFTDIVGYTALMGEDERRALDILNKNRELQRPLIELYNGRWIKELGDGVLATFPTATDAVLCAIGIQKQCSAINEFRLRIGIHLGEVVFNEDDVFGDGVNIASRIQALASIGGIWISETIYNNVSNKNGIETRFIKEEKLKNVKELVRIYEVQADGILGSQSPPPVKRLSSSAINRMLFTNSSKLALIPLVVLLVAIIGYFIYTGTPGKEKETLESKQGVSRDKSIVVLPFLNMSNDRQQDYFADGMMDEILNDLFKIGGWRVISRTSAMAYKGTKKTGKEIAKELDVANLLEGSVQKDGDRIRIRVQLIDGRTDVQLWAETYERSFKDVFSIQTDIAKRVANELKVTISPDVKSRIERLPTASTEAYNFYLQAIHLLEFGLEEKSIALLEKAIALDSGFAEAYSYLALSWLAAGTFHGSLGATEVLEKALPLLQKALQLDPNLASAHSSMGMISLWYKWDFNATEKGYIALKRLNPSNTADIAQFSDYLLATGRYQEALKIAQEAVANDKNYITGWALLATAYYFNHPEKSLQTIKTAISLFSNNPFLTSNGIRIGTYTGNYADAIQLFEMSDSSLQLKNIPLVLGFTAVAYVKGGKKEKAEVLLNLLKAKIKKSSVGSPSFFTAGVYTAMGENDLAFQYLENAFNIREVEMYWLKVEPLFRPLHADPRFETIVNKIGYPQ